MNKIMVPVEFERTSALALDYAGDLASRFDARLYVVHVADDVFALPAGTEASFIRCRACSMTSKQA